MLLTVSSVSACYGSRLVFENVTFRVRPGQLVAVVGPSGSGKSTLLAVGSGLLRPSSETVAVSNGSQGPSMSPAGHCAWIPQGAGHLGARSVLDNAMLGALGRGLSVSDARRAALSALQRVGLGERCRDRAATLSGGELQRLSVARALCLRRAFVFADEPTGSLDVENTRRVFRLLRSVADDRNGVVIATHDLSIAQSCDHVVEL